MAASEPDVADLLGKLRPATREVVLRTWLATDVERLLQLLTLSPVQQDAVARRLDLGFEWGAATEKLPEPKTIEGATGKLRQELGTPANESDEVTAERGVVDCISRERPAGNGPSARAKCEQATEVPGSARQSRKITRVPLSTLRPNAINATIYRESLSDEKLRDLADHIARYGQQDPILVDTAWTILDGERRFKALRLIGAKYADVIVDATERSAEEIEDLILDAFSLKRKLSVFEQLQLYEACVKSYTRRYGRAPGRPRKLDRILSGFWDANRVKDEAAAAAGLGSRETARQAVKVIKEADPATKEAMLSRAMTISAAYELLPKRPGKMLAREDSRPLLEAIGSGVVDAREDEDGDDGTDDTGPDAVAPRSRAAATAQGADEFTERVTGPTRKNGTLASGKASPDAARPPSSKADGGSLSTVQPRVPATCEPAPDEPNADEHPSPLPQGGDVADGRLNPPRDLETGQEGRAKHGGLGAANRAKISPAAKETLERALMEVETYGDGLAASDTKGAAQALEELARRLNEMLARWVWA
jgi:hypothetical protein